ncbi:DUF3168 domain-containing protein [Mongoliimonas terrestris]|uniref:DUF3168 domain-containing protein n=1 Tax=Mongoliimonas terrestris TaxID=1709001 RepID=UPI0009499DD0|nr:DUF3168 domain-containing protein [Mongoliimonas terrestris]
MEEALVAFLLADDGVAALVGSRVQWVLRPQASALPAIVLHRIDGDRDYTMGGPSGLVASRVQVDCWGETFLAAKQAARAVLARMQSVRGINGDIAFQAAFAESERGEYTALVDAGERLYRVSTDYIIWHSEG